MAWDQALQEMIPAHSGTSGKWYGIGTPASFTHSATQVACPKKISADTGNH
jgi:hypothetical protein